MMMCHRYFLKELVIIRYVILGNCWNWIPI